MLILLVDWCLKNNVPVTTAYRWIAQESFPTSKQHGMRWVEEDLPVPVIPKGRPKNKFPTDASERRYTRKLKKVDAVPAEAKTLAVLPDKSSDTEQPWNPLAFAGVPAEETLVASPEIAEIPLMPVHVTMSILIAERSTEVPAEVKKRGRPKGTKNKTPSDVPAENLVVSKKEPEPEVQPSVEVPVEAPSAPKRGRPKGSKNKSKNP